MHSDVKKIIEHYQFERIPLEGTWYKRTYTCGQVFRDGVTAGTAIIGLYCNEPESSSKFHRLSRDETWHFYKGDPFNLFLLYEDGTTSEVTMGADVLSGQLVQFTVPAGVWQAGCLLPGSEYALFGCTMTPGFTGDCFELALAADLMKKYPDKIELIRKLAMNEGETKMPEDYNG
jgi:predicted cupin superfamily sugar epimerase